MMEKDAQGATAHRTWLEQSLGPALLSTVHCRALWTPLNFSEPQCPVMLKQGQGLTYSLPIYFTDKVGLTAFTQVLWHTAGIR